MPNKTKKIQDSPIEKFKNYADVHVEFVKACRRSGVGIINSMNSYWYNESRPDSIRFSQGTKLESLLDKYSLYCLPTDYSSDSGKYEIEAKYAVEFLEALISLQNELGSECTLGQTELQRLLSELNEAGYLNAEQVQHYLKKISAKLTLEERNKLAEANRDFNEAITLANIYKNKNINKDSCFVTNSAIYWLTKIFEFKPNNASIDTVINLDEFLQTFSYLNYPYFFKKTAQPLLDALKRNSTIVKISFGVFFNPDCVNESLGEYIAETKTLKKLDVCTTWSQDYYNRLQARHMRHIAYGLKFNTLLEELDVSDQPIRDEGLMLLLEALASNPNTKLKVLNVFSTGITEKGQKALEEFLQTNKTLEWVNVRYNRGVSPTLIESLTHKNKLRHEAEKGQQFFDECFADLKKIVQQYALTTPKIRHGLFAGELPRNLREINVELDKMTNHECSKQLGINNIINIAQKMGNQHPILRAANKCNTLNAKDTNDLQYKQMRLANDN